MDATSRFRGIAQPPGIDATLGSLGGPVFAFAPQGRLAELAATTQTVRGRVVSVALSYTYFRHPLQRDNPANFVALTPPQARAIEQAESAALPDWLMLQITRARYPALWEVIRTAKAAPGDRGNALEERLTAHANDVRRTTKPRLAPLRTAPPPPSGRVRSEDLLASVSVLIDGESHRGRRLEVAPGIVALGARVDDRYLTVVYDEETAPGCRLEFVRRPVDTTGSVETESPQHPGGESPGRRRSASR